MTGIVPCPECGGVTGAHAITCPTLVQSSALPVTSAPPVPKTCPSCGATGYHKAACPLAMASRPDPESSVKRRDYKAVMAKVLQVDRDLGHPARPRDLVDQIIAELMRERWTIS